MGQITAHSNPHSSFSLSFFPLCVRRGFDEKILHLAVQHRRIFLFSAHSNVKTYKKTDSKIIKNDFWWLKNLSNFSAHLIYNYCRRFRNIFFTFTSFLALSGGPKLLYIEALKVYKIENFFDSDFGICVISLLVMHK
jgi:hypothetical protein